LKASATPRGFYKREHDIAAALAETDRVTERYMEQHVLHFRMYFSQIIALLSSTRWARQPCSVSVAGWSSTTNCLLGNSWPPIGAVYGIVGISQLGTYLSLYL
jgi:hypothetical protein